MRVTMLALLLLVAAGLNAERVYHSDGRSFDLSPVGGITALTGSAAAVPDGAAIKRWLAGDTRYLLTRGTGGLPVYRYGRGYVVARPELFWRGTGDVDMLAERYGLTLVEILPGYGLYKFTVNGDAVVAARRITEDGHGWAFPNLVREVQPRLALPQDALYADYQWALHNRGFYNDAYGDPVETLKRADIRFEDALRFLMKVNFEPAKYATKVAIMDSGVVTTHPDLIGDGGKMDPGYDAIRDVDGGDPHIPEGASGYELATYAHGTDCAGIAAAESNDIGVTGVCPWCGIYPVLALEGVEGSAISEEMYLKTYDRFVADPAIVAVNCSFGMSSEYGEVPMMPGVEESHTRFMRDGRNGKGGAIMYASGNDGVDASYDGMFQHIFEFERNGKKVSHRLVIVGATSAWDTHIDYSNWGMELTISTPSLSSYPVIGIATTHIPGTGGLGDYTAYFSGTSAASPFATGAMGFIFSLNPDLTLEEAVDILYKSADRINPETGFWDENGFSPKFGHGRVNLHKAARLALGHPMCDPLTTGPEELNGIDDDCDGWVDEGLKGELTVGLPCEKDEDCVMEGYGPEQVRCAERVIGYTMPGNYCILTVEGEPCPDGSLLGGTGNSLDCLRECGPNFDCGRSGFYCTSEIYGICLPYCSEDTDCPEGNYCDGDICHMNPSPNGGPCASEEDCMYTGSYCDTSKPGGYCFTLCDDYDDSLCPDDSKCIYSSRSRTFLCAPSCTSDDNCRPDDETDYYKCHVDWQEKEGVCFRPCRNDAECGDDGDCNEEGRCVPWGWVPPDDAPVPDEVIPDGDVTDAPVFDFDMTPGGGGSKGGCALLVV